MYNQKWYVMNISNEERKKFKPQLGKFSPFPPSPKTQHVAVKNKNKNKTKQKNKEKKIIMTICYILLSAAFDASLHYS